MANLGAKSFNFVDNNIVNLHVFNIFSIYFKNITFLQSNILAFQRFKIFKLTSKQQAQFYPYINIKNSIQ